MLTSKNRICRSTTEHWLNVQPTRFSRQAPDQILYTFCVCSRVYGTDVSIMWVDLLCHRAFRSFDSVGIPLVLSLRPLLYCLPPPRRRRGLRLNNATWIPYYVHLPEMVWAVKIISIIDSVELDIGVCSSFPLLTLPRPHPLSPSLSHVSSLASASPASLALVSLRVRFGPLS